MSSSTPPVLCGPCKLRWTPDLSTLHAERLCALAGIVATVAHIVPIDVPVAKDAIPRVVVGQGAPRSSHGLGHLRTGYGAAA